VVLHVPGTLPVGVNTNRIAVRPVSGVGPNMHGHPRPAIAERLGLVTGYVPYSGQQTLPFGDRLRALPIDALRQLICGGIGADGR
jgi:hypothetical protein